MKVGDLVKCPACVGQAAYVGIVIGVYGHKVAVHGGPHRKEVWDICDIHLIRSEANIST